MLIVLNILIYLATVAFMEFAAWFTHKYIMHGWMWRWHKSHHEPRDGVFEKNDLFAVCFSIPAIVMIYLGTIGWWPLLPMGLGVTTYGVIYVLFHDGLVHKRFRIPYIPHHGYAKRLVQAHRLHHAVREKDGGVSFGFLYAPSVARLTQALRARGVGRIPKDDGGVVPN